MASILSIIQIGRSYYIGKITQYRNIKDVIKFIVIVLISYVVVIIMHLVINYDTTYFSKEFLKITLVITLIFLSLGFILNLFEEINFFKDLNVGILLPLVLTTLKVPSLLHTMLPFIVLIGGIWFFRKFKKSDEITAMKISGTSNFSIILIPAFMSIFLGIFFVSALNPVTSALVKKYEATKGS